MSEIDSITLHIEHYRRLVERANQYEKYKKALEFYAEPMNWRWLENTPAGMTYRYKITSKDGEDIGPDKYNFCGGKRARQALSVNEAAAAGAHRKTEAIES